jgi:secondary thiamine-phosphate synthase enzyme
MEVLIVQSSAERQVVDLTPMISPLAAPYENALCNIFIKHTTAALTLAALEPGAESDLTGVLGMLLPAYDYRHLPADHSPAHILAALIGVSLVVPVTGGVLRLGEFQRITLVELQGPRVREVEVRFVAEVPARQPAHSHADAFATQA